MTPAVTSGPTGAVLQTPGGPLAIKATFNYFVEDPMAVHIEFRLTVELGSGRMATDDQLWVVGRELIDTAMSNPGKRIGEGAAKFTLKDDILQLDLVDLQDVEHPVFLGATAVADFMGETLALVPMDAEMAEVDDAEIAALLYGSDS